MFFKIRKGLAYRKIDGQVFIVDAARERLHELNAVGSLIWEGLASGKSGERIIASIAAEFEIDERTARTDLQVFLKELLASGLIETGDVAQ